MYLLHARPLNAIFWSQVSLHFVARAFTSNENGTSKWQPVRNNDWNKIFLAFQEHFPLFHEHFHAFP